MSLFGTGKYTIIGSDSREYEPSQDSKSNMNGDFIKDTKKVYKAITGKNHVYRGGQYLDITITDIALTKANYDILKAWDADDTKTLNFKMHSDNTQLIPVQIVEFKPYYNKSIFYYDAAIIKLISTDPVNLTSL